MEIQAFQHIYANVEQEQSPTKRGGFQTLFYTRAALREPEVAEIEARVLYYPSESAPVKRVFFRTSVGNAVIGQVVPLPEPDSAGRGGRYLAHCYVLPPEEFARISGDPFRVLVSAPFVTTVAAALALGEMETGDIPATSLTLPEMGDQALDSAWSREMVRRLVLAGMHADGMAASRKMLAIVGSPEETLAVMRTAMLAMPTPQRAACSFDTYFYRCNPVTTYCWAVGVPEVPPGPNYLAVDCAAHQVDDQGMPAGETCYERWVLAALADNALEKCAPYRDQVWALCRWLDGEGLDPSVGKKVSDNLLGSVFSVCAAKAEALARRRLSEALGSTLADHLLPSLWRGNARERFTWLTSPLNMPSLLDAAYQRLAAAHFTRPAPHELTAISNALAKTNHPSLRLWVTYWTGTTEETRALLARLSDEQYHLFLKHALPAQGADPLRLILRDRVETFLTLFCSFGNAETCDLAAVAETLASIGASRQLDRLVPYIEGRSPEEIRALQALVKRRPEILESFRLAVEQAAAGLRHEGGVKTFIHRLFRKDK